MAKRTSMISIRMEPDVYNWMKDKKVSPTKVLDEAICRMRKGKWQ